MEITVNIENVNVSLDRRETWEEFVEQVDEAYRERHPGMPKDDPRWLAAGMSANRGTD